MGTDDKLAKALGDAILSANHALAKVGVARTKCKEQGLLVRIELEDYGTDDVRLIFQVVRKEIVLGLGSSNLRSPV
jgi:hypothetical protein